MHASGEAIALHAAPGTGLDAGVRLRPAAGRAAGADHLDQRGRLRRVEPVFHPDSYGYRPGRSALDAVEQCRRRCRRNDWVVDLDIRAFFDSVDHELMLKAVGRHTHEDGKWVLLYVNRWLVAPLAKQDGTVQQRVRGTSQGSAISRSPTESRY
ncbi:reverse transcriptase domain-containing protein [Streptomyces sp. NPDC050625]|uniref:reverse transcriptase domain-containing protein n=1 Tax=Streptomyces sp. NPDC050625 TaxID=3154629 RepID=UPI00344705DF